MWRHDDGRRRPQTQQSLQPKDRCAQHSSKSAPDPERVKSKWLRFGGRPRRNSCIFTEASFNLLAGEWPPPPETDIACTRGSTPATVSIRLRTEEMPLTHDFLSTMLAVRRTG